ncbi:hypothetical protein [Priestia megaterium]|uniref:hypothetical protein n=1 Tax=Priestia megaterium TaxID=1404 RepID=UPI00196A4827|nr:hypothetical protein [Priestia megaterium]QSF42278.1 hypothetical protein ICR96_30275 [Priestia megaterium]
MPTVNAGRAMPDALYIKDGRYVLIRAVNVNPKTKGNKNFYCTFCKRKVVHSQGKKTEDSKPFFRKSPGVNHKEGCEYGKKKNLEETMREEGTLDNLHYGVKPPLVVQALESEGEISNISGDKKESGNEIKGIGTKKNPAKKHHRHILTVDDLFHELMDIKSQEEPLRSKLFSRIIGKIYYPYSQYQMLLNHRQDNTLKKYFFTAGKINVNQYKNLALDEGYAELEGVNNDIKLHVYPFDDRISGALKNLTWNIRQAKKHKEFIGLKVSIKNVSIKNEVPIIELIVYEFDQNHY